MPIESPTLLTAVRAPADERAARATLRGQLRHLERELAQLTVDAFADAGDRQPIIAAAAAASDAPRLESLAELAARRDGLVSRVADARARRRQRREQVTQAQARLERMRRAPGRHRGARVSLAELGAPGCGAYVVRPRLGLVGMLAGWWRVTVSSGCP